MPELTLGIPQSGIYEFGFSWHASNIWNVPKDESRSRLHIFLLIVAESTWRRDDTRLPCGDIPRQYTILSGKSLSHSQILKIQKCLLNIRVSDPDPHGSALIWVAGSGSAFNCGSGSGSRRAKMTHKNRKKSRIFMILSTGCSLLRAEGFSCSLGVLYGGLGISKLQFLI